MVYFKVIILPVQMTSPFLYSIILCQGYKCIEMWYCTVILISLETPVIVDVNKTSKCLRHGTDIVQVKLI